MKTIEYFKLYEYLTEEEGKKPWEAIRSIGRLRKMPQSYLQTLKRRLDGDITADVNEGEIWLSELIENEGMQLSQAFLMLDWIRREPENALHYMAEERFRSPLGPLTDEQLQKMQEAVVAFKQRGLKVNDEKIPESLGQLVEEERKDLEIETQ